MAKYVNLNSDCEVDEVYISFVDEDEAHSEAHEGDWEYREGWKVESRGPSHNNMTTTIRAGLSNSEIKDYKKELDRKGYVEC